MKYKETAGTSANLHYHEWRLALHLYALLKCSYHYIAVATTLHTANNTQPPLITHTIAKAYEILGLCEIKNFKPTVTIQP